MRWILVVSCLVLAGCLAPAPPAAGHPDCEKGAAWAQEVLGPALVTTFVCEPGTHANGYYGGYLGDDRAFIYTRPGRTVTDYMLTGVHEDGHAWDLKRLTPGQRARYSQIVGRPWHIEDFADTFMLTLAPGHLAHGFYGTPNPTTDQRASLCAELFPC